MLIAEYFLSTTILQIFYPIKFQDYSYQYGYTNRVENSTFPDQLASKKPTDAGLQLRVHNENLIFLFLNQNICCGYSNEPSQSDGSFEHPKHMLKLMGKKIFTISH